MNRVCKRPGGGGNCVIRLPHVRLCLSIGALGMDVALRPGCRSHYQNFGLEVACILGRFRLQTCDPKALLPRLSGRQFGHAHLAIARLEPKREVLCPPAAAPECW